MTREQGQFDEDFAAQVQRAQPAPDSPPAGVRPLTAEELGAMLCRIRAIRVGTGEEIVVILSAEDWRQLMEQHGLEIRRARVDR